MKQVQFLGGCLGVFGKKKHSGLKSTAFEILLVFCQNKGFNSRFLTDKVLLVATE